MVIGTIVIALILLSAIGTISVSYAATTDGGGSSDKGGSSDSTKTKSKDSGAKDDNHGRDIVGNKGNVESPDSDHDPNPGRKITHPGFPDRI